jgi:hypothetical protein
MMLAASTLMLALAALPVRAQDSVQTYPASFPALQPRKVVPFDTGERLTYDVRFGAIKVGTGRMEVVGTQDIRGRESWHTRFTVKGGIPFYKVNDRLESWIDTRTFESLRFVQDLEEGSRDRERFYEIYPERATYSERAKWSMRRASTIHSTMPRSSISCARSRSKWEKRTSSTGISGPTAIR